MKTPSPSATWDALWRYDLGTGADESLVIGMEFQSKVDYFMHGRLFVKAALNMMGLHVGPMRLPLCKMSEEHKAALWQTLREAGLV